MVKVDHIKHVIELSDGVGAAIDGNVVTLSKDCLLYTSDAADE